MKTTLCILMFVASLLAGASRAGEMTAGKIDYKEAGTALEGYLAVPKGVQGKVPAVLIIHDWMTARISRRASSCCTARTILMCPPKASQR